MHRCLCLGVFLRRLKMKFGISSACVYVQVEERWLNFIKLQCNLIKRISILQCELRWFWELKAYLRDKHQSCHVSHLINAVMHQWPFTEHWILQFQNNAFALISSFLVKTALDYTDGLTLTPFSPPPKCFSTKPLCKCIILRHNLLCLILNQLDFFNNHLRF